MEEATDPGSDGSIRDALLPCTERTRESDLQMAAAALAARALPRGAILLSVLLVLSCRLREEAAVGQRDQQQ